MSRTSRTRTFPVVIALSTAALLAGSGRSFADTAAPAEHAATFPFTGPRPTIPLMLGERGPFVFILDTGASGSVVDSTFAAELAMPVTGTAYVSSPIGDRVERATVSLASITAGSLALPDVPATALDLQRLFGADGPVGVLSPASLDGFLVTFDYSERRITIARGALPEPDGAEVFGYPANVRLPELPATVAGQAFVVSVDTGSPGGLTLPYEVRETLPWVGELTVVGRVGLVDKEVELYGAQLDGNATIGTVELARPQVELMPGLPKGNVGRRFLEGRVLTMDATHRRIRLTSTAQG